MRLVVVDTETTGVDSEDQVVELALVTMQVVTRRLLGRRVDSASIVAQWHSLIRPTVPVKPDARAAHHLTDAELALAPTMEEYVARRGLPEFDGDVVFAAHNASYDLERLVASLGLFNSSPRDMIPPRVICTWTCARHLWPNAPKYGNQVLRYWLELEVPPLSAPPHRALPDAVVTACLLQRMLQERTVDELVELTATPVLLTTCPFNKHRGEPWSSVPSDYMRWILRQDFDADVRYTCEHYLRERGRAR